MINQTYNNPCTRCGVARVVSKTWTEEIVTTGGRLMVVSHSESVCHDAHCQAIVDKQLAEKRRKKAEVSTHHNKRS